LADPIFGEVEKALMLVHEAEFCISVLDKMKADVVHLDLSLAVPPLKLSPVELLNLRA